MFKKSAIAAAVAGVVSAPLAVQAHEGGEPTVYGFVNIGVQSTNIDGAGTGSIIFAGAPDGSFNAHDTANTRFGFKGSKDLGNGLSASYRIEIGMGTTSGGGGGPVEDGPFDKRLAFVRFDGNFGSFTIGNQWGIQYEYLGWNTYRSDGHGGAAWYEATRHLNDDAYGLRVSNAFTYTYGGGGYSADPFTFSVQAILDPDTAPVAATATTPAVAGNDETIDALSVGAAATFGPVTINGLVYSESDQFGPEPTLTGVGFRWRATSALYIGGTFMNVDVDDGRPDDATTWNLVGNLDFGGGYSGMLGVGGGETGEAGGAGDMDTFFLQFQKSAWKWCKNLRRT